MTRIRAWMVPSLLALLLVLPHRRFGPNLFRASRPAPAAPPLPQPGQDRLPLRRRHLDGQPPGRRGRAAHLGRQGERRPVLLAGRRLDRLLGPPARQHRRLRHPGRGRRSPPHHLAPGGSTVVGWSPDGKDVLIASGMASYRHFVRLFRVHADGSGVPEPLPLPSGFEGSFSPDGQSLAYQPFTKWQPAWKRYVGGQTTPIWIVNLKTLDLVKVPARELQRLQPGLGRRLGLLPLRPRQHGRTRPGLALPLRHQLKAGHAGCAQHAARSEVLPGRPAAGHRSMSSSAPSICSTRPPTPTSPSPSRFTANWPTWRRTGST